MSSEPHPSEIDSFLHSYSYRKFLTTVPTGLTPKTVIWKRNKSTLYQYLPQVERPNTIPILIVYSLINKPYILDLRPGTSLIEYLLGKGFNVYLLDWGIPCAEDANLMLEDYILEYLPRAVKHTLKHSCSSELTLLSYCLGATLALSFVAACPDAPIKNLVTLAAPVDFQEKGLLHNWLSEENFDLDYVVDTFKLIPGEMLDIGTRLLRPYHNLIKVYTDLCKKRDNPKSLEAWLSLQKWLNDTVPFAGGAFRQCVNDLYRHNKLIKGELRLGQENIDLRMIKSNLLNVIAEKDYIVLPSQSKALTEVVSSKDKQELNLAGGHVGMVVGSAANKALWPALSNWLEEHS